MRELDWAVLRNVVIVVLVSTAGLIVLGTTLLAGVRLEVDAAPKRDAVRSSAGGVSPAGAGTTTITSAPLGRADAAAAPPRPAEPRAAFEVPQPQEPPALRGLPPMPMPMPVATPDSPPPHPSFAAPPGYFPPGPSNVMPRVAAPPADAGAPAQAGEYPSLAAPPKEPAP